MSALIDLYSDTRTKPTAGMRAAIASAQVGDEQADEDPTTLALSARIAELLGMEAGIFLPSGTMANLVSIFVHTRPGDELIADAHSHIITTEAAGAAALAGVSFFPIVCQHGIFDASQLTPAIRAPSRTAPRSALLCVEQTTNFSGGAVWEIDALRSVRDVAKERGLRCHLDGARLLNAVVATGISAATYVEGWDSAWIDLSKGLGCPVGAVLCGSQEFVSQAADWKYRLGGAMRQSGVLAAAGLYALDNHVERLADDHANAKHLWQALCRDPLFRFDPPAPTTNILRFRLSNSGINSAQFADLCLARGLKIRVLPDGYIRVMTHLDITADMVKVIGLYTTQPAAARAGANCCRSMR